MAKSPHVGKRQLEQDKRARAERKRQKRLERSAEESVAPVPGPAPADQQATLDALAALHERFADGGMGFDEFESAKHELTSRLGVD